MTRKSDKLSQKLEELALKIVDDAMLDGITLADRMDIMKTLSGYLVGTRKLRAKNKGEEDEGAEVTDFDTLRKQLKIVD